MGLVRVVVLSNSADQSRLVLRACFRAYGGTIDGLANSAVLHAGWRKDNIRALLEAFHPTHEDGFVAALREADAVLLVFDGSEQRTHHVAPLLATAREALRERTYHGAASPFATVFARQRETDDHRDILDAMAFLELNWIPLGPHFETAGYPDAAIDALAALERAVHQAGRRSVTPPGPRRRSCAGPASSGPTSGTRPRPLPRCPSGSWSRMRTPKWSRTRPPPTV